MTNPPYDSYKPYTFEVMTPRGYNDGPVTIMARNIDEAAELASQAVEARGSGPVVDVMDNIVVIAEEEQHQ